MLLAVVLLYLLTGQAQPDPSLLKQGLLALNRGDLAQARRTLETASLQDPKNAFVWSSLAETYLRLKLPGQAFAAAKKAETDASSNPLLSHALAVFYAEAGQTAQALRFARQAVSQVPSPENEFLLARVLLADGQPEAAWENAKTNPPIAFAWAQTLLKKQKFQQADAVIEPAVAAHPDDPQLVLTVGVVRYGQRRFDEAVASFLKVIALDPSIEQPYLFLGRMLEQAGPHLAEIKTPNPAWAAREPGNAKAQLLLAKVLLTEDRRDPRAEEHLRKALALDDKNWEAHYQLGAMLANQHQYDRAAAEFQRSIELAPREPLPHYHLAQAYDRMGRAADARSERAIHAQLTASPK